MNTWFVLRDVDLPRFTNAEVVHASDVSIATLQTWVNRGIVAPASGQNPGYGQRRLYSTLDVLRISLLSDLTMSGVRLAAARMIADYCMDQIGPSASFDNDTLLMYGRETDWPGQHVVIDDEDFAVMLFRSSSVNGLLDIVAYDDHCLKPLGQIFFDVLVKLERLMSGGEA